MTSAGMAAKNASDARKTAMKNSAAAEEQKRTDEALFNRQYYQDMTERSEVKNMLRKLQEQQAEQRSANEARGAVLGTTEEQQIAQQDSLNKSYANSLGEMTANASTLRDGYLRDYQNNLHNYYTQRRQDNTNLSNLQKDMSNQWGQAANNAFQAAGSFAGIAAGATGEAVAKAPAKAPAMKTNTAPTGEAVAKAPAKAGQYQAAADTITNPLEQSIYHTMSNAAETAPTTQQVMPKTWAEQSAVYKQSTNPWEVKWNN